MYIHRHIRWLFGAPLAFTSALRTSVLIRRDPTFLRRRVAASSARLVFVLPLLATLAVGCDGGDTATSPTGLDLASVARGPLTIDLSAKDFGEVTVGQSASQTFTITNAGTRATGSLVVTFTDVRPSGLTAFFAQFGDDGCTGTSLGKGKQCSVTVTFAPPIITDFDAILGVGTKKPGASVTASLSGTGLAAVTTTELELLSGSIWWSEEGADFGFEGFGGAITMSPNLYWFEPTPVEDRDRRIELRFADVVEADGELRYRPIDPAGPNVSLAYRYLRGSDLEVPSPEPLTSTSNPWDWTSYIIIQRQGYAYQDRRHIAVAAWDVETSPATRLAVGFLENNVPGGLVNGVYGPAYWGDVDNVSTDSPREWLFVFDTPYSEGDDPDLTVDLTVGEEPPLLAIITASRAAPDRFPQDGDVFQLRHAIEP